MCKNVSIGGFHGWLEELKLPLEVKTLIHNLSAT